MDINLSLIILVVSSYLIGSIPTGLIVGKCKFKIDLRKEGSGNTGSTNVMRVFGMKWGIFVLVIDVLKGFLPAVLIAPLLFKGISIFTLDINSSLVIAKLFAGLSAVLGHIFPIYAGFRGGKGVNTAAGLFLAVAPYDILIAVVVFLITLVLSGYVSLGSILAGFSIPIILIVRQFVFNAEIGGFPIVLGLALFVFITLIVTHRTNIKRLKLGTENRFHKAMIFRKKIEGDK